MSSDKPNPDPEQDAVAKRLARLREAPVDTARLDARLRAALPARPVVVHRDEEPASPFWNLVQWLSPMRALAALLLLALTTYLAILAATSQPVMAHPEQMALIYKDALERRERDATFYSTLAGAKAAIRSRWAEAPSLPQGAQDMQMMSCCVHEIGKKRLACVTFEVDQQPVTLAIAPAKDIRCPVGDQREVNGVSYMLGSAADINMAMIEDNGNWYCVMGRLPTDQLISVLKDLRSP